MKRIVAIIEKTNDGGISIYSDDVYGAFGYGLNEDETKKDFCEVLEEQAQYYFEKHNVYPEWYQNGYKISYIYDTSVFI